MNIENIYINPSDARLVAKINGELKSYSNISYNHDINDYETITIDDFNTMLHFENGVWKEIIGEGERGVDELIVALNYVYVMYSASVLMYLISIVNDKANDIEEKQDAKQVIIDEYSSSYLVLETFTNLLLKMAQISRSDYLATAENPQLSHKDYLTELLQEVQDTLNNFDDVQFLKTIFEEVEEKLNETIMSAQ